MPSAVSKRQYRFMMAILHGKAKDHPRGVPPKSVASKYSAPSKDAPEQSGENRGGTWHDEHHAKNKEKVKKERVERKKSKKELKKAFEDFYKGNGAGVIVTDQAGRILIGHQPDGMWATPGGHVEEGESFEAAALRELKEETGLIGRDPFKVSYGRFEGNESVTFHVSDFDGSPKDSNELKQLKFVDVEDLPLNNMRQCSKESIKLFLNSRLSKNRSLKDMVALERLEKNIMRGPGGTDAVYQMNHGDALKLVGNSAFRFLRNSVRGMKDEDFKDVKLGNYVISLRKHINDVYSGRVIDGHKMIHQFTNRSLPQITADLMSLFEWYLPEDEPHIEKLIDESIHDDAIMGGLDTLADNYKKHSIGNIYAEMEAIREEIRNDNAVDVQQVEQRIMKLFDKLEDALHEVAGKHNELSREAGKEIESLEDKLRQLQVKVDELSNKPKAIEAFTAVPNINKDKILSEDYCYLSRPQIEISPNGKIKITFASDWTDLDRENLMKDMRAKVVNAKRP